MDMSKKKGILQSEKNMSCLLHDHPECLSWKNIFLSGKNGLLANKGLKNVLPFSIIFGVFLFVFILSVSVVAGFDCCDSGFSQVVPVCINNTGGSTLTYYPLSYNLSYYFDMQPDFDDIRFINVFDTEEPYWIENKLDGEWCLVWFNATYIKGGGWSNDTSYLYYGNPSASSVSDGNATFEFFDDFEGASVDTDKWTDCGGITVLGSEANLTSFTEYTEGLRSISNFSRPATVEGRVVTSDAANCWSTLWIKDTDATQWYTNFIQGIWIFDNNIHEDGTFRGTHEGSVSSDVYSTYKQIVSDTDVDAYQNDLRFYGGSYDSGDDEFKVAFTGYSNPTTYKVDWVFVRKYASPEPSAVLGVEEDCDCVDSLVSCDVERVSKNEESFEVGAVVGAAMGALICFAFVSGYLGRRK